MSVRLRNRYGARHHEASQEFSIAPSDTGEGFGKVVMLRLPVRSGGYRMSVRLDDLFSRRRGLAYLGRESMGAAAVPVHATARMSAFLSGNGPWKRLVDGRHIDLRVMSPGVPVSLAPGLSVTALRVPHREEESDVVGFLVSGPTRRLLYIPDIDDWSRWDQEIATLVGGVDYALLDATFYSPDELGARSMADVPHPLVPSTMARLEPLLKKGHRVILIHMNHTNPMLRPGTRQRADVLDRGFELALEGLDLPL